jgi:hypothetical protein
VEDARAGCGHLRAGRRLPLLDGIGGRYFEDCSEAGPNEPGSRQGVAAYALDPDAAQRLWQVSVQMLAA